jgi:hypothetical protein
MSQSLDPGARLGSMLGCFHAQLCCQGRLLAVGVSSAVKLGTFGRLPWGSLSPSAQKRVILNPFYSSETEVVIPSPSLGSAQTPLGRLSWHSLFLAHSQAI